MTGSRYANVKAVLSKVPEVTLVFWIIKIAATTLGETGGDAVSMTENLGYAVGSVIFIGIFVVAVAAQITAKSFHPFLYWAVIVATTTAGTTMADFADRSLGIGYAGGSSILFVLLMASLGIWYWSAGSVSVDTITSPKVEMFYCVTILFSRRRSDRSDIATCCGRNGRGSCSSTSVTPPRIQATTLESQMIHMIQELFGQTLKPRFRHERSAKLKI